MADTNVQITLSADSKQIRNELKLIDKELRELGGQSTTAGNTPTKASKRGKSEEVTERGSTSKNDPQQDSRDKALEQLSKEASLIRKELQNLNKNNNTGGTPNTPESKVPGNNSNQTAPSSNTASKSGLEDLIGKLATFGVVLKGLQSAWSYASSGAQSSATGEALAYKTYGSTLAYSDYYDAKKNAKNIGAPFGYSYDTVMTAGDSNMSKAGFTTVEDHTNDMTQLLGSAKAWGLDTTQLSSTAGYMTSIGVTENGDQKKFADMLAESIVAAEMTGREEEQLQVLETISENLARTMVKVDDASLNNVMGLYTSLANNNPTLKGQRGSDIIESLNSGIVNGSSTLDVLLGWGTDYTGVSGRVELEKLKEEGLTNPETLAKVFNNFENMTGQAIDSDYGQMFLTSQMGLTYSQVEALLQSKDEIMSGNYSTDLLSGESSTDTSDRLQNYDSSDVRTQEQYELEKQDTKEVIGEGLNDILAPFRDWYSSLGDGGKVAVDAVGGAAQIGVGIGGVSLAGKGLSSAWSKFKGTSGVADDVIKGTTGAADDVIKGATGVTDDVIKGVSKGSTTALKGATKALPLIGAAIDAGFTIYDVSQAYERGDTREVAQEAAGGIGSIAGGLSGAAGGAAAGATIGAAFGGVGAIPGAIIGSIVGGVGGSIGGDAIGEWVGENIYGNVNYSKDWSDDERDQVFKLYDEVKKLYEQEGNNAAQDYTKSVVTPYLQSIGVSTSFTDDYNMDVGRPDFMKHIEEGAFGIKRDEFGNSHYSEANEEFSGNVGKFGSTQEIDDNTGATEELTEAIYSLTSGLSSGLLGGLFPSNSGKITSGSSSQSTNESESEFQWWNPFTWGNSHAHGNDYVPYDNYKANLHKGETVLSKFEADEYRQGKSNSSQHSMTGQLDLNINLTGDLSGVNSVNQNKIVDTVVSQLNSSEFQQMLANGFTRVQNY